MKLPEKAQYQVFDNKVKALHEAKRVTKPGGIILVAYCMNEYSIVLHGFKDGYIKESIKEGKVNPERAIRLINSLCENLGEEYRQELMKYIKMDDAIIERKKEEEDKKLSGVGIEEVEEKTSEATVSGIIEETNVIKEVINYNEVIKVDSYGFYSIGKGKIFNEYGKELEKEPQLLGTYGVSTIHQR